MTKYMDSHVIRGIAPGAARDVTKMENDTAPLPPELASLGFGPENDNGRWWNVDATLGLTRNENGSWILLDQDGVGTNGALRTDDAIHILGKLLHEHPEFDHWQRRWEYFASAGHNVHNTECGYCMRIIPADDYQVVPAANDQTEWARLATQHESDCEWVTTRAYRRNVAPEA